MIDLEKLQKEIAEWSSRNFPGKKSYQPLLGAVEELGELAHAHLKKEQGIRVNEDHRAKQIDAIADIIIYLIDYCNVEQIDLALSLAITWQQVKQRDWTSNKVNGTPQCKANAP